MLLTTDSPSARFARHWGELKKRKLRELRSFQIVKVVKTYTYWFSITGITNIKISSPFSFSAGVITPALLDADIFNLI